MPDRELRVNFASMSCRVCNSWRLGTLLHGLMENYTIRGIIARCDVNTFNGGRYTLRVFWSQNSRHFGGEKLLKLCVQSVTASQSSGNKRSSWLTALYARKTSRNMCSTDPYAQGEWTVMKFHYIISFSASAFIDAVKNVPLDRILSIPGFQKPPGADKAITHWKS